jgi:hypothetical protein
MNEMLTLSCNDWREISEDNLAEAEVIVEMMIEAGEDLCNDAEDDVQDAAA